MRLRPTITDYDFQLVSYHLMEYLNGKTGTVEISPETYETILKQLRDEAVIIMPEVSEEATISIEKIFLNKIKKL